MLTLRFPFNHVRGSCEGKLSFLTRQSDDELDDDFLVDELESDFDDDDESDFFESDFDESLDDELLDDELLDDDESLDELDELESVLVDEPRLSFL